LVAALGVVVAIGAPIAAHRIDSARRGLRDANQQLAGTVTRLELQLAEERSVAGELSEGLAYLAAVVRHDPANRVSTDRLVSVLWHRRFPLPAAPPLWTPVRR